MQSTALATFHTINLVLSVLTQDSKKHRKPDKSRYERTNSRHSWNSSFLLTKLFLFHLRRHSNSHSYAKRLYQVLRHFDDSPQLLNGWSS